MVSRLTILTLSLGRHHSSPAFALCHRQGTSTFPPSLSNHPALLKNPTQTFTGHLGYVFSLCWGPTGGMAASGSFDESVRLWDVRTGICLRTIAAHADPVTGVAFHPDGSLLASSSYDGLMYHLPIWASDFYFW